jgi:hypothetical protein
MGATTGELKLMLTEAVTQQQVEAVLKILNDLEADVRRRGLIEADAIDTEQAPTWTPRTPQRSTGIVRWRRCACFLRQRSRLGSQL